MVWQRQPSSTSYQEATTRHQRSCTEPNSQTTINNPLSLRGISLKKAISFHENDYTSQGRRIHSAAPLKWDLNAIEDKHGSNNMHTVLDVVVVTSLVNHRSNVLRISFTVHFYFLAPKKLI
ncbi:hypothetical protein RB195_001842 [Necator americanus]|uniref:Uncharacterized protein n=1 Tax=Necator americanus TaxID=51031 RepID=A0ABR1DG65_NECAM